MMKLARIASIALSCIAMGSTQVEGTSISITNGKKKGKRVIMPYGKRMIVEFDIDKKDLNEKIYIGFFQNSKETYWLWQHPCGNQDFFGEKSCKKGTIVVDAKDPDEDGYEQLPLPPGNWHVCLMDETTHYPGEVITCAPLTIRPMDKEDIENSYIETTKKMFRKGEAITASFYSPKPIAKQFVGIYPASELKGNKKRLDGDGIKWIYTGCNNQSGNQEENNDCSKRLKIGQISFNAETMDRWGYPDPDWYKDLSYGKYKLCLVYDYVEPYTQWTCSDAFRIVGPKVPGLS